MRGHKNEKLNKKNKNRKNNKVKFDNFNISNNDLKKLCEILSDHELTLKDIILFLGWKEKNRKKYREVLYNLHEKGKIYLKKNGKYTTPENEGLIKGDISISTGNYGFVDLPNNESYFIPGPYLNTALDGDTVLVKPFDSDHNKKFNTSSLSKEGEVVTVLKRNKNIVVGKYEDSRNFGFVRVSNMRDDIYIPKRLKNGAKTGDLVAVKIDFWGDNKRNPEGGIINKIGDPKNTDNLISALLINNGIEEKFSKEVIKELDEIKSDLKKEIENRKDLRDLSIITIDGDDSKDLDDAVYVKKTDVGYKLLVSIADVSYYVKNNSELDKEAEKRGNSIYLVDRVIPMLPKKLSNDLCSLNPNENKLTFTVEIDFDKSGKVVRNDFYKSVIRSKYRMTYNNVNRIYEEMDENSGEILSEDLKQYDDIKLMLKDMLELSNIIGKTKKRRGSIDFELPEIKVILDEDNKVDDIVLRNRGESEKLIENFMVAANEVVAEKLHWEELPAIYRVHENPNKEKVSELNETLIRFGYTIQNIDEIHASQFQKIIEKTTGLPEGYLIHKLILRSMQRARYMNKNLGHFGLASKYYLHFTSPIRRYSDLIVHRILDKSLTEYISQSDKEKYALEFEKVSSHISKTERTADKIEEDSVKIKLIEFMKDKIGENYMARISGMNRNKVFLELENHVEIVYNVNANKDDFIYDEEKFVIINTKTNESYTMGDTLKITIVDASYDKMEIEVVPFVEK